MATSPAFSAEIKYDAALDAVTIEGSIVTGDDVKFEATFLDRHPNRLVIRSVGGRQVPSIAIARTIRERQMTVIVDGFCASACAQIILPAAAERRIRPDSFVAFHGGNLALLQAVRAEVRRELSLMQGPADAASEPEDTGVERAQSRRSAYTALLSRFEGQIDAIDSNQAEFDTGMKLDPTVVEFYLRLTAQRDLRVMLQPGEAQPVRVAVGRQGVCDWWIPDRDSLAKLGLTLRNSYDVPSPELVASVTHSPVARLYFGPPVALDDPAFETLCPQP